MKKWNTQLFEHKDTPQMKEMRQFKKSLEAEAEEWDRKAKQSHDGIAKA